MDDNRFSNDLLHAEPPGEHLHIGFPEVSQQRRKVARMSGMDFPAGVEMSAGVIKILSAACSPFVDVKSKEAGFRFRQSCHLYLHKGTVSSPDKAHSASNRWIFLPAPNVRNRAGKLCLCHITAPLSDYAAFGYSVTLRRTYPGQILVKPC